MCAYKYPKSRSTWKKSELVLHTVAEPPYEGRMSLAANGWTMKRRAAPSIEVTAKSTAIHTPRGRSPVAGTGDAVAATTSVGVSSIDASSVAAILGTRGPAYSRNGKDVTDRTMS